MFRFRRIILIIALTLLGWPSSLSFAVGGQTLFSESLSYDSFPAGSSVSSWASPSYTGRISRRSGTSISYNPIDMPQRIYLGNTVKVEYSYMAERSDINTLFQIACGTSETI